MNSARTKQIKLVGGPLNGLVQTVDETKETVYFGMRHTPLHWSYSHAGQKEGDYHLFCVVPCSRVHRRTIFWWIGKTGKHLGLVPKAAPFVNPRRRGRNEPCRCGEKKKYKRCHGR